MNTRPRTAFWCYFVAMAGPGAWGIMCLLRDEFMPYHSAAVGVSWSEVPGAFQGLILALLKLVGAAWLTGAAAVLVMLLVPFRQGVRWTHWAIPSLALLHCAGVVDAMLHVALNTSAVPL